MRACEQCGGPLPRGCRSSRRFCSKPCSNAAYRAGRKDELHAAHKVWRDATRERRLAESAERRLAGIVCIECGEAIPDASRTTRKFCSRRCSNALSLRERRAERVEAARRRKARLRLATTVGVSIRDWERLVRRHSGCCAYCGERRKLTMDHVVPLSRGGQHAIGNILPACQSCNSSKRDELLAAWRLGRTTARRAA
jgi:5-methylcytosine-specific restriction endonuclease McrA